MLNIENSMRQNMWLHDMPAVLYRGFTVHAHAHQIVLLRLKSSLCAVAMDLNQTAQLQSQLTALSRMRKENLSAKFRPDLNSRTRQVRPSLVLNHEE